MLYGNSKDVFTISLHQENNYPFVKPPSSIDVNLPDGCDDASYLAWLDEALCSGLRQFEPDLICYVAGADPFRQDQLGGLDLTIEGLKQRDELVFRAARARNIPVMVTLAGGYATPDRRHRYHPHQHRHRRRRSLPSQHDPADAPTLNCRSRACALILSPYRVKIRTSGESPFTD